MTLESFLETYGYNELKVFGAIAIIGGLIWGIYFYRSRRKRPLEEGAVDKNL